MRAIVCNVWGEPESLTMEDVEPPALGPGGVRIAVKGCGDLIVRSKECVCETGSCPYKGKAHVGIISDFHAKTSQKCRSQAEMVSGCIRCVTD